MSTEQSHTYIFGRFPLHPDQIFYESEYSVGICNIAPTIPGHVLVIPKRSVARMKDLTAAEITDLFQSVQRVGNVIESHWQATSLTVTLQDGKEAGQTVSHVHVHVLPRRENDFRRNDQVYEALHDLDIHEAFHAHTYPTPAKIPSDRRTIEEMKVECDALKTLFGK